MTTRGSIMITWGEPRPGVPNEAGLAVFGGALGYYDELMKAGRVSSYRVYASATRSFGALVIEGELSTLAQIMAEPESQKQLVLGAAVVQNLNAELMIGGSPDDVAQFYTTSMNAIAEAGIAP